MYTSGVGQCVSLVRLSQQDNLHHLEYLPDDYMVALTDIGDDSDAGGLPEQTEKDGLEETDWLMSWTAYGPGSTMDLHVSLAEPLSNTVISKQ